MFGATYILLFSLACQCAVTKTFMVSIPAFTADFTNVDKSDYSNRC